MQQTAHIEEAAGAAVPAADESIIEILAAKLLVDWLRNRQQLLVPYTVDLHKLDSRQIDVLVHAMLAAAYADGASDGKERERMAAAMQGLRADESHHKLLDAALERQKPLAQVLAEVTDVQTGAIVYMASLLVVDRRKLVNRQYLRYLAARLRLPRDLARSLEQRFRSA